VWAGTVGDLSTEAIGAATKRCIQHLKCEFPPHFPTVAQFRELSQRVEPKGQFTAVAAESSEYRGLPEPAWVKEERYAASKKMAGQLLTMVKQRPQSIPTPEFHRKKIEGQLNNGLSYQAWKDEEGRDFVHFYDHPINAEVTENGSGFQREESGSERNRWETQKGKYARTTFG